MKQRFEHTIKILIDRDEESLQTFLDNYQGRGWEICGAIKEGDCIVLFVKRPYVEKNHKQHESKFPCYKCLKPLDDINYKKEDGKRYCSDCFFSLKEEPREVHRLVKEPILESVNENGMVRFL